MEIKKLQEKLTRKKISVWEKRDRKIIDNYANGYKTFIDYAKTERKAVDYTVKELEKQGFKPLNYFLEKGSIKDGDKIYYVNNSKSLFAIKIKGSLTNGISLVGAHLDAPRLDLKPEPIIEDSGIAMAKTHYYGGVKKYQWLNIPLELHGVVIKNDGTKVDVSIGDDKNDPVFVISDLLPHLDRRKGNISEVFKGEDLNLIMGTISISYEEEIKDSIKLNILNILYEKYGIIEEDLISAELEVVPSLPTRDVGLDRSLIAAYGHDDRICSYTALTALIESEPEIRSAAILLTDKEEIGSDGNTGAKHHFWITVLKKLLKLQGNTNIELDIDDTLLNSTLLSADVSAAFDPNFKDVHDPANAPKLGFGIAIAKYTGARGKAATNDANAEVFGKLRKIFNENGVIWQSGELGKVDQGGGGTIAKFFAEKGLSVIDAGVALLGMHSPYELASKADLYETYYAYKVFLNKN
ncbi:Aspartyl aminopeptidase [Marinitoga hydrogenitolerans DSM 16785]|uniref:M18 family aminopeptidase n=1 Tax=Marinitoga hydrogenitolerans (strain DSM 16785 / JCM 12826 / AT1271) TaxID=1122195 RepID=A0A1M4TI76_MARH1|nr:aminopeptidase [Marinitoga hydrogenitolerans]SHE43977.1 Aspartyl aminopeptidase [Marinitoga hydrogenitolerans DSM 16785]